MEDWERGTQSVRYNGHVAWVVTINGHSIDRFKADLTPQMRNQLHSFLESVRPEAPWAFNEASRDAYLVKRLSGDIYSWWIWSGIQDDDEFKRLIKAHDSQPHEEEQARWAWARCMYTSS